MYYGKIIVGKPDRRIKYAPDFNEEIEKGKEDFFIEDKSPCRELLGYDLGAIFSKLYGRNNFTIEIGIVDKKFSPSKGTHVFDLLFGDWEILNGNLVFTNQIPSVYQISLILLLLDDHHLDKPYNEIISEIINSENERWYGKRDQKVLTAFYLFLNTRNGIEKYYTMSDFYRTYSGPSSKIKSELFDRWITFEEFYYQYKGDIDKTLKGEGCLLEKFTSVVDLNLAKYRLMFRS